MAKPKAKVDSYNSWNKAFRVLTEIVALKWLDQCLPMVQNAAEFSDNISKFTFVTAYNYDIKFTLKKQIRLTRACGLSVFLAQAEMATIPVPHHQLHSRRATDQITKPATNATKSLATINRNVSNSSLQEHPH